MRKDPAVLQGQDEARKLYDLIIEKFFTCEYEEVEDSVAQVCVEWVKQNHEN